MQYKLLILGAGEMQVPVIKRAKERGIYTIVADMDVDAPGMVLADEYVVISTMDTEKLLIVAKEKEINGILTTSDAPVNVVSEITTELGLPSISTYVAKICTNKYLQRTLFKENGINCPFFKRCTSHDDLKDLNEFPYVVKPVDSSASRGVVKVNDKKQLVEAFDFALSFSRSNNVIVESFLKGKEFSVETFTQNNKTTIINITEKLIRGEEYGYFVEDTHIQPARISTEEWNIISNEVIRAISIIGLNNCPSHTEVKLINGKAYIIEIACRLGGDYITSDLTPLSTGINMLDNLISVSLGLPIDTEFKFSKYSAIQFLNNDNYYKCLEFIESKSPFVIRYDVKPYVNKVITNSLGRLGYFIIQSDSVNNINKILEEVNCHG